MGRSVWLPAEVFGHGMRWGHVWQLTAQLPSCATAASKAARATGSEAGQVCTRSPSLQRRHHNGIARRARREGRPAHPLGEAGEQVAPIAVPLSKMVHHR